MIVLKIIVTILDVMLAIITMWFAKGQKDVASRIGFGAMILAYVSSALLIWS